MSGDPEFCQSFFVKRGVVTETLIDSNSGELQLIKPFTTPIVDFTIGYKCSCDADYDFDFLALVNTVLRSSYFVRTQDKCLSWPI